MKTCELDNRFFQPVTFPEQREIQGGCIILVLICAAVAGAAAAEIFGDWDNFKAGLMGGVERK